MGRPDKDSLSLDDVTSAPILPNVNGEYPVKHVAISVVPEKKKG